MFGLNTTLWDAEFPIGLQIFVQLDNLSVPDQAKKFANCATISDIYRVDEVLARTFNMLFVNTGRALFTLVVISISTPAFIAFIIPLALV